MATLAKRYKKYTYGSELNESVKNTYNNTWANSDGSPQMVSPKVNLATGTGWHNEATGSAIGAVGGMVGSLADSLGPADAYGKKTAASNILGGAGKGAALGASVGSIVPGVGTLVGGVVGGVAGAVGGVFSNSSQGHRASRLKQQEMVRQSNLNQQTTAARVNQDPSILYGSQGTLMNGYFAAGGPLNVANQTIENGTATRLNSSAAEFNGPSHNEGGIQIPGMGAEVEGNETTNGSYVFSDRLGFAKLHKPIAKAIGKIEQKTLSPERVTSIKLLKDKENQLKLSQEYTKHMLGLN